MNKRATSTPAPNNTPSLCGDCGMPLDRRLRVCRSCGRPTRTRHGLLVSLWHVVTLWLTVVCVIYAAIAVLRFGLPITFRVTCVKQVVPSRLVVFQTATYESLLSSGDCSVPRGAVVLLTSVPGWLTAAATRDTGTTAGAAYVQLLALGAPLTAWIVRLEGQVVTQLRASWHTALTDLCTPAWIAAWCRE